ncbi:MAG: YciI family protein [Moraxellaceae bacterium]|nr:YciI family protein [Moraxellaceae bacterium]
MRTLTLMFYEIATDGMDKAPIYYEAHVARLQAFQQRGVLLMAGPYGMPPAGALGVFTERAAADEFAREDPFVLNGVVSKVTLHDWAEALTD